MSSPRLRATWIDGVDALGETHRALLNGPAAQSFDQTLPWFECLARLLQTRGDVSIVAIEEQASGRCLALLPLMVSSQSTAPWRMRWMRGLANYYTGHFAPLLDGAADTDEVLATLAQALRERRHWQGLDLNPLGHGMVLTDMMKHLSGGAVYVRPYFRFVNWYLPVQGRSFGEYFQSLPKQMREILRRRERKARTLGPLQFRTVTDAQDLPQALQDYATVYRRSWKRPEPDDSFIGAVAKRFAECGWLRLGLVHAGGEPVAAQIWFVYRRTASIFKLAHDARFSQYSVGSLLTMAMMRVALDEDQVTCVDFQSGNEQYKRAWMSAYRERWGIRAYRLDSPYGLGCAAFAQLSGALRGRREPLATTAPVDGRGSE